METQSRPAEGKHAATAPSAAMPSGWFHGEMTVTTPLGWRGSGGGHREGYVRPARVVGHPGGRPVGVDVDVESGHPLGEAVAVVLADLRDLGAHRKRQHVRVEVLVLERGGEVDEPEAAVPGRPDGDADGGLGVGVDVAHVVAEEHDREQPESRRDIQRREFLGQAPTDRAGAGRHRQPGRRDAVVEVRGERAADRRVDAGLRQAPEEVDAADAGVAGDRVEIGVHPVPVVQAALGDGDGTAAQVDLDGVLLGR